MSRRALSLRLLAALLGALTLGLVVAATGQAAGNQNSGQPSITPDGRYVVFWSRATNLGTGDQIPPDTGQIYLHDRRTKQKTLISRAHSGGGGNGYSFEADISPNARYVAFKSDASNLTTGDTESNDDVFVYDRELNRTRLVSVTNNGENLTGGGNFQPSISADGRYVAFMSQEQLTPEASGFEIFVRDLVANTTRLVTTGEGSWAASPDLSADGRWLVFSTSQSLGGIPATGDHVYLHDMVARTNKLVSKDVDGIARHGEDPVVDEDGKWVAFTSTDIISSTPDDGSDTTRPGANQSDVYLFDVEGGWMRHVSKAAGLGSPNGPSWSPVISSNTPLGDSAPWLAYQTDASNIRVNDTNGVTDVIHGDLDGHHTYRASIGWDEINVTGASSISNGGLAATNEIVFESHAEDIDPNDGNGVRDAFLTDPFVRKGTLISTDENPLSTPDVPTNVRGEGRLDGIYLQWSDNSSNEQEMEVRWVPKDTPTDYEFSHKELPANTTSYLIGSLQPGTRHDVEVRACNLGGCSPWTPTKEIFTQFPPQVVEEQSTGTDALDPSQLAIRGPMQYRADPVNTIFGNFVYDHVDLEMPGFGPRVVAKRTYNSALTGDGMFGFGWDFVYDMRVTRNAAGDGVDVKRGDGRIDRYAGTTGRLTPPPGSVDELVAGADGSYRLHTRSDHIYSFNPDGRIVRVEDTKGEEVILTYGGSGGNQLTGIRDAALREWAFAYNAEGRVSQITDPSGRTARYAYDDAGNLVAFTNPAGGVTRYEYDGQHKMTRIVDARGKQMLRHVYDPDTAQVLEQVDARGTHKFEYFDGRTVYTDPTGAVSETHYDAEFRVTKEVDALGGIRTLTYDGKGQVLTETDALARTTSYEYDARGNTTKVTDAAGGTTVSVYDGRDNLLATTDALGRQTSHTYDAEDNRIGTTDALGKQWTYEYDAHGQLTRETDPLSDVTVHVYDARGNRTSTTDPSGRWRTFGYDSAGRRIRVTDKRNRTTRTVFSRLNLPWDETAADGGVTRHRYDNNGNETSTTDPRGGITRFTYSAANDRTSETDATGRKTTFAYDAMGRRTKRTLPDGRTFTTAYDALGRVVRETTPLGHATAMTYDAAGNLTSITDARGKRTDFAYDRLDRLVSVRDARGGTTTHSYDAVGNRTKTVDPRQQGIGLGTSYGYDALNRKLYEQNAVGHRRSRTYDAAGRMTSATDGAGVRMIYAYDRAGRMLTRTAGGTVDRFSYDHAGNRLSLAYGPADARQSITYAYDSANRLTKADGPSGLVTYEYDRAGNRTKMTQPGATTSYAYDAANRLTEVSDGGATPVVGYGYDSAGRMATQTYGNGLVTTSTYDADGRLTRLQTKNGTAAVSTISYTLDAYGNRTRETANGFSATHAYDELSRLVSTQITGNLYGGLPNGTSRSYAWAYDAAGNRTSQTLNGAVTSYAYDLANRLRSVGGTPVTHDAADRLTNDGTTGYEYDARGRLIRTITGSAVRGYEYDGDDHRIAETAGTARTRHLLDTVAPHPRRIASTTGQATDRFVYGTDRAAQVFAASGVRYEHADGLGTPRLFTAPDRKVTSRANQAPFGERLNGINRFGLSGEPQAAGAGLVHLRARDYSPVTGRFLTTDPEAGEPTAPASFNPYSYVTNNPVNVTDPTGRACFLWVICWPDPPAPKPPAKPKPAPAPPAIDSCFTRGDCPGAAPAPAPPVGEGGTGAPGGTPLDESSDKQPNSVGTDPAAGIISDKGLGIISDKGLGVETDAAGNIISDKGLGLQTDAAGNIISDKGLGVETDAAGNIISDKGLG